MIVTAVVLVSLVSAVSRASLNVLDRAILRKPGSNLFFVNFLNNALPLLVCVALLPLVHTDKIIDVLSDARTWLLAASVQANALAFTWALKRSSVAEISIWSKLPDAILPLMFSILLFEVHVADAIVAIGSTIAVVGIKLFAGDNKMSFSRSGFIVFSAVVLHAIVSSALIVQMSEDFADACIVAGCIIAMRFVYTTALVLPGLSLREFKPQMNLLFGVRAAAALVTQITFIWALNLGNPTVAWSIFNMTSVFATVIAAITLGERPNRADGLVLGALTLLLALRLSSG